jgi:hypothetical protein
MVRLNRGQKKNLHALAMKKEKGLAEARYGRNFYLTNVKKSAKWRYKKSKGRMK